MQFSKIFVLQYEDSKYWNKFPYTPYDTHKFQETDDEISAEDMQVILLQFHMYEWNKIKILCVLKTFIF
jgi:hypothetical protein